MRELKCLAAVLSLLLLYSTILAAAGALNLLAR